MSSPSVVVSTVGRVRVVKINRPHKRNAVDGPTARSLYEAFKAFDEDDSVDVAILTGTSGYFCAGADLAEAAKPEDGKSNPIQVEGDLGPMGPSRLRLSKPVVAAVEGHAVAGGLELALWCDVRIAAKSSVLGVFCRRPGVPLIDGGTVRLGRIVGRGRALDLVLTGRSVLSEEAHRIGLVNKVVEDGKALEEAIKYAQSLTAFPQETLRSDRLSLLESEGLTESEGLKVEFQHGVKVLEVAVRGATKFSKGAGRGGSLFDDGSSKL